MKCNWGSSPVLRTLSNQQKKKNSGIRQLLTSYDPVVLADQMLIHMLRLRLPIQTADSWERYRNGLGGDNLPTIAQLQKFVDVKTKGRRGCDAENRASTAAAPAKAKTESNGNRFKPYDKTKPRHDGRPTQHQSEPPKTGGPPVCVLPNCKQTHWMSQCEIFRKMNLAERAEVTQRYRLCRCCLSQGHMAAYCTRNACAKCPEAKIKHHFRLCPKTTVDNKTVTGQKAIEAPRA